MFTRQERQEAELGTSSSTPTRGPEREDRAGPGGLAEDMKAIVQDTYGSAAVLELKDIDKPEIGDDEVLVRVRAAGVNPGDWAIMSGLPYIARPGLRAAQAKERRPRDRRGWDGRSRRHRREAVAARR